MSNIKMIIKNNFDNGVITASPAMVQTSTVKPGNMQLSIRKVARTTGTTQQITVTYAQPQLASGFALVRHNLEGFSTVSITRKLGVDEVYTGDVDMGMAMIPAGQFTPGLDTFGGLLDPHMNRNNALWHEPVIYDSLIIDIDDQYNPDGWIDIDRIFDGPVFSPQRNFRRSAEILWEDDVKHVRTQNNSLRSIGNTAQRRVLKVDFTTMHDDDRIEFEGLLSANKRSKDMFISAHPDEGGQKEVRNMFACKRNNTARFTDRFVNAHSITKYFIET